MTSRDALARAVVFVFTFVLAAFVLFLVLTEGFSAFTLGVFLIIAIALIVAWYAARRFGHGSLPP